MNRFREDAAEAYDSDFDQYVTFEKNKKPIRIREDDGGAKKRSKPTADSHLSYFTLSRLLDPVSNATLTTTAEVVLQATSRSSRFDHLGQTRGSSLITPSLALGILSKSYRHGGRIMSGVDVNGFNTALLEYADKFNKAYPEVPARLGEIAIFGDDIKRESRFNNFVVIDLEGDLMEDVEAQAIELINGIQKPFAPRISPRRQKPHISIFGTGSRFMAEAYAGVLQTQIDMLDPEKRQVTLGPVTPIKHKLT
jgi:hypothetical protein